MQPSDVLPKKRFRKLYPCSEPLFRIPLIVSRAVKRVHLKALKAGSRYPIQVVLAEKDRLDLLDALLEPDERIFLQQAVKQDINSLTFPRAEGMVFVRLLKHEPDPFIALEDARLAGNDLLAELRRYKIESLSIHNACLEDRALAFAEGMALGSYQFLKYFTKPAEKALKEIWIGPDSASEAHLEEANALIEAVFLARDLVNEPHSHFNTLEMADAVENVAKEYGFSVDILGKENIEALKMGGLLAVNRASQIPPRFCILEWKPAGAKNSKPVVLVGKGVVYDTGGLSLKPSEAMDYMKCDMAGAATVVSTLAVAAKTNLPVHLVGLIPVTDNKIGDNALSPGDVITMGNGKTVEVVNTDAEGRIILADALHYAKKYEPLLAMDIATLTGSAVRALGTQAICYMGTASKEVKVTLEDSGFATYERLVELPLWKEFADELKSNIADLRNLGSSNAGMITAGKFLENFVDYPWLHLDIAGPAYLRTANSYRTKDGTGVGVRLLYHFLKKHFS
ncbi:MAG: leucyl aminopeptidase [Saprospiraceae bacterium]|nr:leucyl aminopeptidase [Saprospiraceae bacterium]